MADILTGTVLTELPLDAGPTVKKLIAKVEQASFTLPVLDDKCPANWADLLVDGHSMIVLTLDDVPTQAWVVIGHERGDVTIPVTGATLEECVSRTNVPDLEGTMDDAFAVALLMAPVADNFGFEIAISPCGKVSDHLYDAAENRKVLDAVNELAQAPGGPEWRIVIEWTDTTRRAFTKTIEIAAKIGTDRPDAVFDLDANGRGVVESYKVTSSYAEGKGATSLIGTSGDGSGAPSTGPIVSTLVADGWPVWEERVNFTGLDAGTVADEDAELDSRTRGTLAKREHGTQTWFVSGSEYAPRPGVDYSEGDTLIIAIAPQGKRDPIGGVTPARAQGWELELATGRSTPQLLEDPDDLGGDDGV